MRVVNRATTPTVAAKSQVFFRLPQRMAAAYNQQISSDGYGKRGKSRWTREAIEGFLAQPQWIEFIEAGAPHGAGQDERESIYLERRFIQRIDVAIGQVKALNPQLEGLRSAIIRCSVAHRLLQF